MKIVELFSGNGDITKVLKEKGYECVSVDYDASKHPDLCVDVYSLPKEFFQQFDVIWLSPDCTTYSIASHGIHRYKGGLPKSKIAEEVDVLNVKLFQILKELNIPFICENPRGHFRHMNWTKDLYRITLFYSTYGALYTKPTDLFSNREELLKGFNTKKTNGTRHLDNVTSGKDFLGRCRIPALLLEDICEALTYENKSK